MRASLGVDLGGTHIGCVLINEQGDILAKHHESLANRSFDSVVQQVVSIVRTMLESSKLPCLPEGLGIAVPGNVDKDKGTTRYLPNFGWLQEMPLADALRIALKATDSSASICLSNSKIEMRNDGRCAALAESRLGVGRGAKVFSMLTLGTGIGGALIDKQGALFDGSSDDAGDFGHHVIASGADAFPCVCGKHGCFEQHASAQGLVKHYLRQGGPPETSLSDALAVLTALKRGDVIAKKAFDAYRENLTTGLANLVTFYNPDVIALGGGLAQASELFDNIVEHVDNKTLPATRGKVKILPALLGTDSCAIGAAMLCF